MRAKLIGAILLAASIDCTVAWMGWTTFIYENYAPEWAPTAFFFLVAACLGAYAYRLDLRWGAIAAPAAAALLATFVYTLLGVTGGSFADRHVHAPMIAIYTSFETILAAVGGAVGMGVVRAWRRFVLKLAPLS